MKKCSTLDEVRAEIDRIDTEIVKLIAERGEYVYQAAGFKKSSDEVKASSRVEEVISRVRNRALSLGADADVTEAVYRAMINGFIASEMNVYNRKQVNNG